MHISEVKISEVKKYYDTISVPIKHIENFAKKNEKIIRVEDAIKRNITDILFGISKHYFPGFKKYFNNEIKEKDLKVPLFGLYAGELNIRNYKKYHEMISSSFNDETSSYSFNNILTLKKENKSFREIDTYFTEPLLKNGISRRNIEIISTNLPHTPDNKSSEVLYYNDNTVKLIKECIAGRNGRGETFKHLDIFLHSIPQYGLKNNLISMIQQDTKLSKKVRFYINKSYDTMVQNYKEDTIGKGDFLRMSEKVKNNKLNFLKTNEGFVKLIADNVTYFSDTIEIQRLLKKTHGAFKSPHFREVDIFRYIEENQDLVDTPPN